jgi:hypothetical protein
MKYSNVIVKIFPSKTGTPLLANFVITTIMGIWAFYYFWSRTKPLTIPLLVSKFIYFLIFSLFAELIGNWAC